MLKKLFYVLFIIVTFNLCSCSLFGIEAEKKFNEVNSILDSSINRTVTEDFELPKSINGVTLTWTSNNPAVITNDGKVTRENEDVIVTLTVKLTYKKDYKTISYKITVKANTTYTITFDSQGGTQVESITAEANSPITKPLDPTRDGYIFIGWYESESFEKPYMFTTMPNRNITLYARWEKEKYTITFDSQGGTQVESITAEANSPITKPLDPTRDGYIFIGWYESESSEEPYVFITMPNYYLTLYARWEKIKETYTITFDSRGGSHVESITAEPDSPIAKPADPIREGYFFLGWYESETIEEEYQFTTMPNNNITLYAKWEKIILGTEGLVYELLNDDTYMVIGYNGTEVNVIIPNFYNGKRVSMIGNPYKAGVSVFENCTNLVSIVIPEGITTIGSYAFSNCSSLKYIILPEGIQYIGYYAFLDCSELVILAKDSEKPSGWNSTFNGGRPVYYGVEEVLEYNYLQYIIIDENITITRYLGNETTIEIPSQIGEYKVTKIGTYAFYNCKKVESIILPEGLVSIENSTFYNCKNLKSITLSEGLKSIDEYAFYNCTSLRNLTIPKGVTSIGDYAFSYCESLTSITLPEGVTSIGDSAFSNCYSLINITIPEGVEIIGDFTFDYCISLASIIIPQGIMRIGDNAFSNCESLTSITLPEGITSIGDSAFSNCYSLINITIPEGVEIIGDFTFNYCISLASIIIPKGIMRIGDNAFSNCESLTSITLPEGVKSIGNNAFSNCESLTSITLPESLKSIGYYAFYNCISLRSINLPKGITSIEFGTFYRCISLISITIPEGVTSIDNVAFSRCTSLTSITLPEGLIEIGISTFFGCTSLTNITIPESVTSIDKYAFANCINLIIYAKVSSEPSGWDSEWNFSNRPVYYGVD